MRKSSLILALVFLSVSFVTVASPVGPVTQAVTSQENGFDAFRAHRQQEGVALAWIFTASNVTSFIIEHSFDGSNFITIGEISPESKGWNNFKDNAALPGNNHYRIGARLSDNSIVYSDVEMVRIVKRK